MAEKDRTRFCLSSCCAVFLLLCFAVEETWAVNPGVQMRVTKKGIDYANAVAQAALANELKTLKIPDQSGDDHHLSWSLTSIRTEGVTPPSSTITLRPDLGGLTWALSGLSIKLHSDWRVKYKQGWVKVSTSGSVDISVERVSMSVSLGLGVAQDERPSMSMKACSADIGDVSVHFHGGTAFILNLFKGVVEDKIKHILRDKICDLVNKEVTVDAAAALKKMKVTVDIDHHFLLDYGLLVPPGVTAQYLQTQHKGEVYWEADKKECPFKPAPLPPLADASKMLYLWLTEYTATSFLYNAHNYGYLQYNVTQDDLPPANRSLMNTTCTGLCVGSLIPQVRMKYPNSVVEIHVKSSKQPQVKLTNESMGAQLFADIKMFAKTPKKETVYLLRMNISLMVSGHAAVKGNKVIGHIDKHSFKVTLLDSAVGRINPRALPIVLGSILDTYIIPAINHMGETGVDLPLSGDVTLTNLKMTMLNSALLLSTDLKYQKLEDAILKFVPGVH